MCGGESVHLKQCGNLAGASEAVLNAHAEHGDGAAFAHDLAHGGAKSADDIVFLGGDYGAGLGGTGSDVIGLMV